MTAMLAYRHAPCATLRSPWSAERAPSVVRDAMWLRIPHHEDYEASDDGRIRRAWTGKELSPHRRKDGYVVYLARPNGGRAVRSLRRLILLTFVGPQPTERHDRVRHLDGDPGNNAASNLRWEPR